MRAPRKTDVWVQVLFALAAIAYSGVAWEAIAGYPLDPARAYLSELAAENQPTSSVFRALDALTGVLVLAGFAVSRHRWTSVTTTMVRWSALLLAAFAVLTIVDALVPLACAGSADPACAAADAAGTLGFAHQVHALTSSSALGAAVGSTVLLALASPGSSMAHRDARSSATAPRRVRVLHVSIWVGVSLFVATTAGVSLLAVAGASSGTLPDGGGYLQRAQVVLLSAYLAVFPAVAGALRGRPV